jgi:hypothetical protein
MAKRKHVSTRERMRLFMLHKGVCHFCKMPIDGTREAWDISHEIPLELGGADDDLNRKPAHREKCHRPHTAAVDAPAIAKSRRIRAKHIGAKGPSRHPIPGSKGTRWKKKISGETVRRER